MPTAFTHALLGAALLPVASARRVVARSAAIFSGRLLPAMASELAWIGLPVICLSAARAALRRSTLGRAGPGPE